MKAQEYLNTYLRKNVRISSFQYVHDYILNNEVKNIIEFGTSRVDYEGNSTIFFALIAKQKTIKFVSVDNIQNNLDNAKNIVEKFDPKLLEYIDFVCDDQYNYMKTYVGNNFQFAYLDCDDNKKHESLKSLLDSKILDSEALICVDDMIMQDPICEIQVNGVVDIANNNPDILILVERKDYSISDLNEQQTNWNNLNKNYPQIKENFTVHTNSVKQFEYQILLKYNNNV